MLIAKTRSEVCEFFGISTTTFRNWQARGMPGKSGAWDLKTILQWKIDQIQSEQKRRGILPRECPHCGEEL